MLNVNKNINLTGTSVIDGVQVMYMSASISTDGGNGANVNTTITNQELYNANKAQVRADKAAFEEEVYKIEDELLAAQTLKATEDNVEAKTRKAGK